ncbi:MAG TPA: PrgI family protein [Candidatus Paceibacterota bacterium]|nr:PrgI family protein [Candidatus Paceibacterota bacterium]
MQFQVPQFIEIEDKVVGPFTFKQFIFVLGAAGGGFFIYRTVWAPLSYILIALVSGFSLALAFYKINDRPFINVVESWFKFSLGSKRYLWKKEATVTQTSAGEIENRITGALESKPIVPRLTAGKLKDIAWSLDIKEKIK